MNKWNPSPFDALRTGQAKALLRQLRETVEDIEDARTIERVKRADQNKPRIPWVQVKKELELD